MTAMGREQFTVGLAANGGNQPEAATPWVSSGAIAVNCAFPSIAFYLKEAVGGCGRKR